jgi:RimJ/RimL family protein N-acetyltransferase
MISHPLVLSGDHVVMEPLSLDHVGGLANVGLDPDIWHWTPNQIESESDLADYVRAAIKGREAGHMYPFATRIKATGEIVGSSRYGNIVLEHKRLEIGWTWIGAAWQRTFVNSEAKLLMLGHAFEVLDCNRVELKTDALNLKSRRAMLGIGCTEEGTLRHHVLNPSGRLRDTVYYSILRDEWPATKQILKDRLKRN